MVRIGNETGLSGVGHMQLEANLLYTAVYAKPEAFIETPTVNFALCQDSSLIVH